MPATEQSMVSEAYWKASENNEPVLDYVMFTAGVKNVGEVPIEYQCLILPFSNSLCIRFMVTVSTPPDPSALDRKLVADIGLGAADEPEIAGGMAQR